MTTNREVSMNAGVCVATVSRVIRQPDKVAAKTRRQVMKAIEETGYHPNLLVRSFRTNRSNFVLALAPNIANPFFSRIIRGIEQAASEVGYSVLLGHSAYLAEREDAYAELAATRRADGMIQFNARMPAPIAGAVADGGLPFVNACELIPDYKGARVSIDNIDAAARVTRHLLDLGHRKIGVITGPKSSPLPKARLKGVRAAIRKAPDAAGIAFIAAGKFTMESGYVAIANLAKSDILSAFFCFNDEMAIGAIQRFTEAGYKVPGDISIAGFDDIEMGRFSTPKLTTISQPAEKIGETAMGLLLELIEGRALETHNVVLPAELVVRESTGPTRKK